MDIVNLPPSDLIKLITDTLSRDCCVGWDSIFLSDIRAQLLGRRGQPARSLSPRQYEVVEQCLIRNSNQEDELAKRWEEDYRAKYMVDARVLAAYYTTTGYFRQLAEDILKGETPKRTVFMKMYNNKYAQKVLNEYHAKPKFQIGMMVHARTNPHFVRVRRPPLHNINRAAASKFRKLGGVIVGIEDRIVSAARGAKIYKILPIGAAETVHVEERGIKKPRKSKAA